MVEGGTPYRRWYYIGFHALIVRSRIAGLCTGKGLTEILMDCAQWSTNVRGLVGRSIKALNRWVGKRKKEVDNWRSEQAPTQSIGGHFRGPSMAPWNGFNFRNLILSSLVLGQYASTKAYGIVHCSGGLGTQYVFLIIEGQIFIKVLRTSLTGAGLAFRSQGIYI